MKTGSATIFTEQALERLCERMQQKTTSAEVHSQSRVEVGEEFILDASSRSNDDGSVQSFSWMQVSGPYKFDTQEGARVTITPPSAGLYVFELTAMDMDSNTSVVETIELCVGLTEKCTTTDTDEDGEKAVEAQDYNATRSNKPTSESSVDVHDSDDDGLYDGTESISEGDTSDTDDAESVGYNNSRSNRATSVGPDDTDTDDDSDETDRLKPWNHDIGHRPVPSQVKVILLPPAAPGDDPIEAHANEVRAWNQEEREDFLETVKERAELQSGEDLENFARGILLEREDVEEIEITDKQVMVRSRVPAKLFGIFDASLGATMQINEAGEVTESLPWYSFLYSKSLRTDEVQQALQQEFQSDDEESSFADLGLQNEFQVTARALEVVLGITASSDAQNHNSSRSSGNTR